MCKWYFNLILLISCILSTLLFFSCEKNTGDMANAASFDEIDYTNSFSLNSIGDCALIKCNNQYLFLRLDSQGPASYAKVKWWYQDDIEEAFDFEKAVSGEAELFEKIKVLQKKDDVEYIDQSGSQLFISVKGLCVEWSAGNFFYLPAHCRYTLLNNYEIQRKIFIENLEWKKENYQATTAYPDRSDVLSVADIPMEPDGRRFLLKELGDCALVKGNDQYLFLSLESLGPGVRAKIKWWHLEQEGSDFIFSKSESGTVELFEKYEETKRVNNTIYVEDSGGQRYLRVGDIQLEWSYPGYFYLPHNYEYKLYEKSTIIDSIHLQKVKWNISDSTDDLREDGKKSIDNCQ